MAKAVSYYRVSTDKQGRSGLGLEAQQKAVRDFAQFHSLELVNEFTEIETGKGNKRPILKQAIQHCIDENAVLLLAKQDRLARDVEFVSSLLNSKIKFISVDYPDAPRLLVHIRAAVDEDERVRISIRTKEALAAAKERGVILGKYGRDVLSKRNADKANEYAKKMKPTIERLRAQGYTTIRQITKRLNRLRIKTYKGTGFKWHPTTVFNLINRINKLL